MSEYFSIHPVNPQERLISQAADIIRSGGIVVYPTDSSYALGCRLDDKTALMRIQRIRQLDNKHHMTLMCRDLSEIATYAWVDNPAYRLLKSHTPGPYTFLLRATRAVPRRLQHPKRKTIGIRVPDCKIALALLNELNEPLMTTSMILPHQEYPFSDPEDIREAVENQVDLIIDGGFGGLEPTSIIDLSGEKPVVRRIGQGAVAAFE
ncbi:MAG: threonylcarbamoyl-AMP synthase [Gammaproteobacteria bacterium RIFCSPHIGHO2_02_FULL_42_13]|nr:MAG: threonylcarbamoyl-AMP synthase [Gammaproteobacteria bacterium RIFCSPHIGHO2_02_FULL_42_13]OGT70062.1 MAG: threonylcarbamoyl-AMP synthase [Gammaproteobacteria bacterium RIFCSPLOWO2_02_FULL_42_9]